MIDIYTALEQARQRLEAARLLPDDSSPDAYEVGSPESHAHPAATPRWERALSGDASFFVAVVPDPQSWTYSGCLTVEYGHVAPGAFESEGKWEAHTNRKHTLHATKAEAIAEVERRVSRGGRVIL